MAINRERERAYCEHEHLLDFPHVLDVNGEADLADVDDFQEDLVVVEQAQDYLVDKADHDAVLADIELVCLLRDDELLLQNEHAVELKQHVIKVEY